MGAVASLMYINTYKKDSKVKSIILDSPFSKLEDAIRSIGNFATKIPKFLISMVIGSINTYTMKKCNLDIKRLSPIDFVHKLGTPVFFIGGAKDRVCPLS